MKNCVNFNSPDVVKLAGELNVSPVVAAAKIGLYQDKNGLDRFPTVNELQSSNEVNTTLKAVDILQSDKAKQVFDKGNKNNWDLNKILTELQVPKEQKQLILDLGKTNINDIITDLLSNYSYTVEINTAKDNIDLSKGRLKVLDGYIKLNNGWYVDGGGRVSDELQIELENKYNELHFKQENTKYYSNLTVPGGTNYTEQEIATPLITPSIKGHAQFATDNGIGWFRSDDKDITYSEKIQLNEEFDPEYHNYGEHRRLIDKKEYIPKEEYEEAKRKGNRISENTYEYNNYIYEYQDLLIDEFYFKKKKPITLSDATVKTRRILEVQSDLFQKGRDLDDLIYKSTERNNRTYDEAQERRKEQLNQNQFLQLLNKDNNWVTFFVKSIIQDSAKKGYEKVLFPSGNTASKVEGHTTLEEFKKQKEDRIKELEKRLSLIDNIIEDGNEKVYKFKVLKLDGTYASYSEKQGAQDFIDRNKKSDIYEINQLKQELERVETEGFGALKPIYNFYENTVANILNKTYGKVQDYGNTPIKNGVDNLFEENKELSKIGNKQLYSAYLNTIFPDSKVKDIVYHGSKEKFDKVDITKSKFRQGFYFTKDKSIAKGYGNIIPLIVDSRNTQIQSLAHFGYYVENKKDLENKLKKLLNIKELGNLEDSLVLQIIDVEDEIRFFNSKAEKEEFRKMNSGWENLESRFLDDEIKKIEDLLKSINVDGDFDTMLTNNDDSKLTLYAVGKSEQIHILGSKQDIEGFKDFVKESSKPKVTQITNEYGNTWNEVTIENKRDESTILLNKKDLSEFESDENESIFSESVKEPVKVKEDNFEVNKKLLFGNEKDTTKSFTAKEVLQNIIDFDLNLSDAGTNLVFKAMNILNLAKTRVKIISQERFDELTKDSKGEGTAVMAYNYDAGNVIYMTENSLKMFNKEQILESFIHEVAHNLSIKALINPVTFEEHEFHDLIFKAFEQYKYLGKTLNGSGSYGFTNEKEFVAELYSNAEFRKEIQDLDKGFWRKFKDAVRRLFGLPKSLVNDELIDSILLIESVEKFIESNTTADENVFKNDYSNSFNSVLFKKVKDIKDADTYELETIDKKAEHLVNKAKSKVAELINRTKKSDKEKAGEFLEEFKKLEKELEHLSSLNKWKAITGYMLSFRSAIDKLNNGLENKFKVKEVNFNGVKYIKDKNLDAFKSEKGEYIIPEDQKNKVDKDFFEKNNFIVDSNLYNDIENEGIKSFSNKDYLDLANDYDDYLASYDLLEDVKKLIADTVKDHTLTREDKLEIKQIKETINEISKPHDKLIARIKDLRKDSAIKLFADPSNNKKVTAKWRSKLSLEYNKLKNPTQSRDEWIGYHLNNTHAEEFKKDLEDAARKIIENPYTDISSYVKNWMDLLNTNSPLINMIANIVGKMRDSILKEITAINFKISDVFDEYSKFNNSLSMSKKHGNLVELNESEDTYYLKGKYSIKFKENYNKMLNSLLEKNKELENYDYKKDVEYKKWIKENTIKNELGQTIPHSKYLNKPLNPAEEKALEFFRTRTKSNHELNYKGKGGLYSTFFGAEYYKLPSKTKGDRERTLEGDIKGQIKDKWTDLKETKVDDIHYGEAFDSKGGQLQRVKINFRGKLDSKDQSLDLFTVYRAEEANAISFKHRSANENKLKLFLDIAKNKEYKTKSLITSKWALNIFAKKEVQGQTFSGEKSNEYAKIKGILETALYDITSYNEEKFLGKYDANKVTSKINGAAAFVGMTLNIGSGAVNFLNGKTVMIMLRIGGKYINKSNLSKSEIDYMSNLPEIMADIGRPVKKSFDNQMLNMFDIIGGMNINKQDFMNNSTVKEMMSLHNANFINESVEHGLNCILTRAVLRSIPVMNKNHKYIDKEGKETTEDKAASIFDMLYMDKDGILKTKEYFTYSKFNLVDDYHKTGKQSINYLLKKNVENLYGVYDSNMKAEISKNWYGKLLMMFKGFFLSQMEYRYKGLRTANKSKDELDDEDLTFNNAEQEFTEGIYVTAIRTFFPLLRHLNLQMTKENFKNLSDSEKANLRQVFFEVSMTAILLPLIGAMMAANAGDDDDELYFLLFAFRRLESEMSQFRNIAELNRMISNPIAANRFLQNGFTVINDIFTPINFQPQNNESYFDWLSENSKGENVMGNHAFRFAPWKSLYMNTYKQRYSLIDNQNNK